MMFWALAFASVFWSQIQWTSYVQFLVFSSLPLSVVFFLSCDERQTRLVHYLIIGVIGLLALVAVTQYYMFPEMLFYGRAQWPLNNPNSLGAVFSLGAFLACFPLLKPAKIVTVSRFWQCWWGFVLILMCAAVIVTGSRGALGALVIMGALGSVVFRKEIARVYSWKALVIFGVALAGAVACLTLTGTRPDNVAITTTIRSLSGSYPWLWTRGDIWLGTWRIIQDHFWLGTGIGTFPHFYAEFQTATDVSSGRTAHNDPLQYWSEMGVGAFVLFYLFCGSMLYRTVKALGQTKDTNQFLTILLSFCALGAMVMHSHVSFNLHNVPILFVSGFLIAMWVRATDQALETAVWKRQIPYVQKMSRLYRLYYVANIWVLLVLLIVVPFTAQYFLTSSERYSRFNNMQKVVENINLAKIWSFGQSPEPYIKAATIHISTLDYDYGVLMKKDREARIDEIVNLLEKTQRLNPRAVGVFYNRALLAQVITDNDVAYGEIDQALENALQYKPRHMLSRSWLVDRYAARGQLDEAVALFSDAMPWCVRTVQAEYCYQKMATLLLKNGDIDGSTEMLTRARALHR